MSNEELEFEIVEVEHVKTNAERIQELIRKAEILELIIKAEMAAALLEAKKSKLA